MRHSYTAGERALTIIARMAGVSLEELNEALENEARVLTESGPKTVPLGSWKMIDRYAEDCGLAVGTATLLWQHVKSPRSRGDS